MDSSHSQKLIFNLMIAISFPLDIRFFPNLCIEGIAIIKNLGIKQIPVVLLPFHE